MKRLLLIFIALLTLCGCEKAGPEYLVSSIGVDLDGGQYNVCFESIIINSENTDQALRVLEGKGATLQQAVEQIRRQCTQPLQLSHCGVIIMGDGITQKQFEEIKEYSYDRDAITLSAFFVRTKNAKQLLSLKPLSSACVGYDIMGLIKQNKAYKNRFFEVIGSEGSVDIPRLAVKEGGLYFESKK